MLVYGIELNSLVPLVLATLAATVGRGGHRYPLRRARCGTAGARDPGAGAAAAGGGAGAPRGHPSLGSGDRRHTVGRMAVGRRCWRCSRCCSRRSGCSPSGRSWRKHEPRRRELRDCSKPQVSKALGWLTLGVGDRARAVRAVGCAARRGAGRRPAAHVPARARGVDRLPRVRRHRARLGALAVAAHPGHGVGPGRRRVGRARRDLHRAHARARLAVGSSGVGRLVGVGRAPRHHRGALLPLPRLPRAAPHPGDARSAAPSGARSPRSSPSSTCRSSTSR